MERPIEGPEPYKKHLTSDEAGKWLEVKGDLFESLMATHLPTVKPIYKGRYKMWSWYDVACLGHVLERGGTLPPGKKSSPDESASES